MGMDLKIAMGWGLTDLEIGGGYDFSKDHRINEKYQDMHNHDWLLWNDSTYDFARWLDNILQGKHDHIDPFKLSKKCYEVCEFDPDPQHARTRLMPLEIDIDNIKNEDGTLSVDHQDTLIVENMEFGDKRTLLFLPFEMRRYWFRTSDLLDTYFYENVFNDEIHHHGLVPQVFDMTHKCGIYPYLGMFKLPGKDGKTDEAQEPYYLPSDYNMLVGRWHPDQRPKANPDVVSELLNFYRPHIPSSILLYTWYTEIFKNWEETVQQLRPMMYMYWS